MQALHGGGCAAARHSRAAPLSSRCVVPLVVDTRARRSAAAAALRAQRSRVATLLLIQKRSRFPCLTAATQAWRAVRQPRCGLAAPRQRRASPRRRRFAARGAQAGGFPCGLGHQARRDGAPPPALRARTAHRLARPHAARCGAARRYSFARRCRAAWSARPRRCGQPSPARRAAAGAAASSQPRHSPAQWRRWRWMPPTSPPCWTPGHAAWCATPRCFSPRQGGAEHSSAFPFPSLAVVACFRRGGRGAARNAVVAPGGGRRRGLARGRPSRNLCAPQQHGVCGPARGLCFLGGRLLFGRPAVAAPGRGTRLTGQPRVRGDRAVHQRRGAQARARHAHHRAPQSSRSGCRAVRAPNLRSCLRMRAQRHPFRGADFSATPGGACRRRSLRRWATTAKICCCSSCACAP